LFEQGGWQGASSFLGIGELQKLGDFQYQGLVFGGVSKFLGDLKGSQVIAGIPESGGQVGEEGVFVRAG
jgi:hypothetical protein